jgi:Recombinase/Resolvase, N terminal domain
VDTPTTTDQLERIAAGEAGVLELDRLTDGAHSLKELTALFGWLRAHKADLVAHDVELDTRQPQGRRMVALLEEVARWERAPERPRGRPGLMELDPLLTQRIATMREQGNSLNRIADALNADHIPTPRGGELWRASSVQAALGYRRPPPPPPGAPHPPKPPPRPPGPKRHPRP